MKVLINALFLMCFFLAGVQVEAATEHDLFDQVLKEHVKKGVVDYPAIQEDKRYFEYLDYLAGANPDSFATEDEKLAFYINAYNALAIKGIIDGLSPSSLFGRLKYFKKTEFDLAGEKVTLDHIEKGIIIPVFQEARIHFAIVCASASCPKLISEAFTADKLEEQMETNTRAFINNDFKNNFDLNKKRANVSKIFDWFEEDFEKDSGSVQKFLAKYVDDPAVASALNNEELKVKNLKYDWSLNGNQPN